MDYWSPHMISMHREAICLIKNTAHTSTQKCAVVGTETENIKCEITKEISILLFEIERSVRKQKNTFLPVVNWIDQTKRN